MKLAIVGSGISGLAVAHTLKGQADITVFEAGDYFGGHTHTVDVTLPTPEGLVTHGVDTGFLVFNERTYPNLIQLFADLQVETTPSDMSFSVKVPGAVGGRTLEWSGTDLSTVFAQRRNLINPRFWRMLADVLRFNALCTRIAKEQREAALQQPLGDFLRTHKFSDEFRDWYFLPMMGCIWSCPTDQMLQFPVATMIRFCHNHGLIQVMNRPQWFSVLGGARHYVNKILTHVPDKRLNTPVRLIERNAEGVRIITDGHAERFDEVVIATHTDQALAMLREPSANESQMLGAIRYQANRAVLHTDASVLPANPKTWAAWNYERAASDDRESSRVCLHYLLNRLQRIPFTQPVVVSLNPVQAIDPATIVGTYDYAHPVFDLPAIEAQQRLPLLQGQQHTWFAGAWAGYGFHEDGLKSGLNVGRALLQRIQAGSAA
ncbi:NAD(P)/FAD-dependent oxidoreductase [Limnohabitans radicicola]|uniref:FAD-dependent oxidoreductase n=1 Tax=Limnohabitans radicicola TaxID=2771427 RepID=A0A927FFP4_9BURK|nr:FAD-dependent oxidoreductase [Limnohabitans radicicola]MBD8050191.1 FAD-dependent oxidoreductase [Limnohabitans radicicola]